MTEDYTTVPANLADALKVDPQVLEAKLRARIPRSKLWVNVGINNLLDENYITSRAPRGIFPGNERHIFIGLEADTR